MLIQYFSMGISTKIILFLLTFLNVSGYVDESLSCVSSFDRCIIKKILKNDLKIFKA